MQVQGKNSVYRRMMDVIEKLSDEWSGKATIVDEFTLILKATRDGALSNDRLLR